MSEKQAQIEEIQSHYREEQQQLRELETRFNELEVEFNAIMEDRRIQVGDRGNIELCGLCVCMLVAVICRRLDEP